MGPLTGPAVESHSPASAGVEYPGRDLEAMDHAANYHRWILDVFRPYLGHRLVEVGAGMGAFSVLLLEEPIESLALVEPSTQMFPRLEERIRALGDGRVATYYSTFREAAQSLGSPAPPDSVLYINVLEHIADDEAELGAVHSVLPASGRVLVFVPAFEWLYGPFDEEVGHYRRYTRKSVSASCRAAGFRVLDARYFDAVGVLPWWLKYRVLRSRKLEPRAVQLYDRHVVPLARELEERVRPPVGKNVLLVAEKS